MDSFMKMFGHVANILKGYAIAIGVAVAIAFVWMWWRERQAEQAAERQVRIQALIAAQMRLALEHPDLAAPPAGGPSDPGGRARYDWYLGHLLAIAGQILALDRDQRWRRTLLEHLAPHQEALNSDYFRARSQSIVSSEIRELINNLAVSRTDA
jgi:hypothetical protein